MLYTNIIIDIILLLIILIIITINLVILKYVIKRNYIIILMKKITTLVKLCNYLCFFIHKWQPKFRPAGNIVLPGCPHSFHAYSGPRRLFELITAIQCTFLQPPGLELTIYFNSFQCLQRELGIRTLMPHCTALDMAICKD